MRTVLCLIWLCCCAAPARACLQFFGGLEPRRIPKAPPKPPTASERLEAPERKQDWKARYQELDAKMSSGGDFKTQNDLAVTLVYLGRYPAALSYFAAIESNVPNQFATAANMGTTYELLGNATEAQRWIRESLRRKTDYHDNSEWIHLKVLEAKRSGINPTSVIGLDFGNRAWPSSPAELPVDADGKPQTLAQVEDALIFQLHERLQFVRAPDASVASLLFDLGNLLTLRGENEQARDIFARSLKYGPANRNLVERRADAVAEHSPLPRYLAYCFLVIGSVALWEWNSRRRARINGVQILSMGDGTRPDMTEWSPPKEN